MRKCGDKKTGYPIRNPSDPRDAVLSNSKYDMTRVVDAFPEKMHGHKELRFLRASSHAACILSLQNLGFYPVQVHAAKMPGGKGSYENIAEVLYNYWLDYLNFEGLEETHDLARSVLLYLFYGTFVPKRKPTKRWPIIRAIHRHLTNGRSRFKNYTSTCFKELLDLLEKHPE